jgi:outer membrane receptor protein involved in Fe transport
MTVTGRDDDLTGVATTSSEGVVSGDALSARPLLRTGEIVETIPGVIVTQHAGGGKANQYFLRGFNLDHGTDLSTDIDGMVLNNPSHGHGQGYTDLNPLIPELVQNVVYKKGPYYAEVGDFGSAGAFSIRTYDVLPHSILSLEAGSFGAARFFFASSPKVGPGHLLYALDLSHYDGPWEKPDDFQKINAFLKYSVGDAANGASITAMAYHGDWQSSDQAPRRAFENGLSRFDSLDDTTGGDSSRYSLLGEWHRTDDTSSTDLFAYASYYDLNLFSNFTYFLDDPVRGDQFEQKDRRVVAGLKLAHTWRTQFLGLDTENTLGAQLRMDNIRNGLYRTEARRRLSTTRYDHIVETSSGLYFENKTPWLSWLRTVAGVRGDFFTFHTDGGNASTNGDADAFLASPKLSVIFGPWAKTEFYLNGGFGFHSNDARGVTDRTAPADPLVRTKGAEIGVRTTALEGLQSSLTLWLLDIDSELVFIGDAGNTEAGRASRRIGVEFANYYDLNPYLALEADFAYSQARFSELAPEGQRIPGSIETVITAGVVLKDWHRFFGALRLRYFGPRDLIEDGTARSSASTLLNGQIGYRITDTWSASLDVFNILDQKANDIDYYYASRLKNETAGPDDGGTNDFHSHPAEPRAFRVSLTAKF